MKKTPIISLNQVSKSYLEGNKIHIVLDSIAAEFQEGECVAFLGRSGSGKSTILNLISGIDKPDTGSIMIQDKDITKLSELERTLFRRSHIGFIYQFFNLIPTLTVLENVMLPLELNKQRDESLARSLLDEVRLLDRQNEYPDRLSGGEQQRVAIIRALVHDPLIVLADEPTGNIDQETGSQVITIMERLIRKRNKTMIIVTHSQEIASFADRHLLLENGVLKPQNKAVV
ncbi:MAG: ABC transporter ATP-binding protein [Dehalococcoidales bacterium]|nr:MAG: ABC transporter ATP-binding protein [Dehalococcoidales bacterium]